MKINKCVPLFLAVLLFAGSVQADEPRIYLYRATEGDTLIKELDQLVGGKK